MQVLFLYIKLKREVVKMADAELSVRITGDTSDLEGAINRVEKELNNLSKAGGDVSRIKQS